jgi:MFS family permease
MRSCAFLILFLLIIANLTVRAFQPPVPYKITAKQLAKPLTESGFLFMTAGFFLFTFGFYIPINYLPVQAISAGMSSNLASYLIPILNAGSLFGRLAAGFLSDKIGRFNIFIVVCYLSGLWVLALWLADSSNASLISFSVLFGFCSGAFVSLIFPMTMQISPVQEVGFRTGIILLVGAIAGLVTNPIAGSMVPSNWTGVQIFAGIFCVTGPTLVLVTRVQYTGWKISARF